MTGPLLLGIFLIAAGPMAAEPPHPEFSRPPRTPDPETEMRRISHKLQLTPDQEGRIWPWMEKRCLWHEDSYYLRKEYWEKSRGLKTKLQSLQEEHREARARIEARERELEERFLKALTRKQRKQYEDERARFLDEKTRRKGGKPPPGR